MDTIDENLTPWKRPRSLKPLILARGCTEYKELSDLRAEGWRDGLLSSRLDQRFTRTRMNADKSDAEGDAYWLPVMASSLGHIDNITKCIPTEQSLRFLDLCCCPGGFSKYVLTKNATSRGVGVSLPVDNGGHGLALPFPERSRFELHWGDLTYYDICSPMSRPIPAHEPRLLPTPLLSEGFQLAMLDGQHRRPQESEFTHPWDTDRLLISQLIIGMGSLDLGGTLIVKLHRLESSTTARIICMIDRLSRSTVAFKPYIHGTRSSFYAIGFGFGLGRFGNLQDDYLDHLKNVWWEMTYGGPDGAGRWLEEEDLDFIVDFETLTQAYLDRLIKLGKGTWRAQRNALLKMFIRIREAAAQSEGAVRN